MSKVFYKMRGGALLKYCVLTLFCTPHILFFLISSKKNIIREDISRWIDCTIKENHGVIFDLCYLLVFQVAFRNVFYLRIGRLSYMIKWCIRPLSSLYINTPSDSFGAGTFIQHGFATEISAQRIGKNCWINQQVTIGFNKSEHYGFGNPIIEDNVTVSCGVKILGDITVGEGSIIGANAVVIKNVPPYSTIIPSPMFIRKKGSDSFERL